jgi:hypothetical protein
VRHVLGKALNDRVIDLTETGKNIDATISQRRGNLELD